MYTIYRHVFPSGKSYIGLTRSSVEKRWGGGNNYKGCRLVDRAIKKYGWENVKHQILRKVEDKALAEIWERFYVAWYRSDDPKYGYNILPGGDVSTNDATEEMRYKLGKGMRGKKHTEEQKQKIGESVRKKFSRPESNGCIGKKASEETRAKMTEAHKKWYQENEDYKRVQSEHMKELWQNEEYKKKVAEGHKAHPRRSTKGMKMSEETKAKISAAGIGRWRGSNSPCSIPIVQLTKDMVFVARWESAGEAQRAGIASTSNIGKCCKHRPHCHSAGGFVWLYESEYEEMTG